jgi:hypothetical protein
LFYNLYFGNDKSIYIEQAESFSMVIAFLSGGLGNQMFQFAAAKALALKKSQELKLDISNYQNRQPGETIREYELAKVFAGPFELATPADLKEILGWKFIFHQHPFLRRILRKLPQIEQNWIVEPDFSYWPDFFNLQPNCLLEGYWQSNRYFEDFSEDIKECFRFKMDSFSAPEILESIENSNSVSIHIRRGDYVTDKNTAGFHGICDADYYLKAIEMIKKKTTEPRFFVFSDDLGAARELLKDLKNVFFVNANTADKSHFDMMLMSRCRHHIIANSTFSWWGAWLNDNHEKIVIAPERWFASGLPDQDLVPKRWMRV